MNDKDALKFLKDYLDVVKDSAKKKPQITFKLMRQLRADFETTSPYWRNKNLRLFSLNFSFYYLVYRDSYSTVLRDRVYEEVKKSLPSEEIGEGTKEIVQNAVDNVTVDALGSGFGYDTVDTNILAERLEESMKISDLALKSVVLTIIAANIRKVYDNFVKELSEETIEFLDKLIEAPDWETAYSTLNEYVVRRDQIAQVVE